VLTDAGKIAFDYADDIFRLGRDLEHALSGHASPRPLRLEIGLVDGIAKHVAERLIEPATAAVAGVRLHVREGALAALLAELAASELDVVIADVPAAERLRVPGYDHLLGSSGTTFFGAGALGRLEAGFPRSLHGAPALLPSPACGLRRAIETWFAAEDLRPVVLGEFDDTALLKVFGSKGLGFFAAPTVIEDEVRRQYGVRVLGRVPEVKEAFYAVTAERRLGHPGVVAIAEAARRHLFT
jgi:LysR family transcriptional activator of nhaA